LVGLVGCDKKQDLPKLNVIAPHVLEAVAVISPIGDSTARGVVQFTEVETGIKVHAAFTGLAPGKHGFHIHQFGDISRPDGSGVGSHFNPENKPHASPQKEDRHDGDLGNVTADKDGFAFLEYIDKELSLNGTNSIVGRGIVIHDGEDDYVTQPTGGSGGKAGQGTIGISKEK